MVATFALNEEKGLPTLSIRINDTQTYIRYNVTVGKEYIQEQDADFTRNIESIAELYEHLVAESDKLIITDDGITIFELEVTIKKKLEKKLYSLQAYPQQMAALERLSLQIGQIRKEMKEDSQKRDQRFADLEGRQNITQIEVERLAKILRAEIKQQYEEEKNLRASETEIAQRELLIAKEEFERASRMIEFSKRETLILIEERKVDSLAKMREMREETERYSEGLARINKIVEDHQNKMRKILSIIGDVEERIIKKNEEKKI